MAALKDGYSAGLSLSDALALAIRGLGSVGADNGKPRDLEAASLEVAVLERSRPARKFRRVRGAALTALLPSATAPASTGSVDTESTEDDEEGSPS